MNVQRILSWIAMLAVIVAMSGLLGKGRFHLASTFEQSATTVWYCAGEAVNEHADPYLVEPLRSCEIRNEPSRHQPWVEPAPLPGYALGAFSLLARLPFGVARMLWFYLLVSSIFLSAVLLAKMVRRPVLLVLLCLSMADAYVNLFYGELPPLAVAVLVAAATLGAAQRYVAAALVASVAMIEPHLGLPACLAMFVWWPRTRITFIITGVSLAALSYITLGARVNIEYMTVMLPVHAASEIAAQDQYSLTRVLHVLGLADNFALKLGTASYFVMTILGVALARRIATAVSSEGLIVLLPPALALLGGPFVHDIQMAAALPAAIVLAAAVRPSPLIRAGALVALVFPWHAWNLSTLREQSALLDIGAIVAASLIVMWKRPAATRALAAAGAAAACVVIGTAISYVPRIPVGPATAIVRAATAPTDLSSANWAAQVSRNRAYSTPDARDVLEKVPLWMGLLLLTGMGIALARRPRSGTEAILGAPLASIEAPAFQLATGAAAPPSVFS